MSDDRRPPIVRLMFGLSVPFCLATAYWVPTHWLPPAGASGWIWPAFVVAIAVHNAYVAATGRQPFGRLDRRGGD